MYLQVPSKVDAIRHIASVVNAPLEPDCRGKALSEGVGPMLDGYGGKITRARHQAKSSIQFDADEVKINNMNADTHLPRHDKVLNRFAAMRKDSIPTNEMGTVFKLRERKDWSIGLNKPRKNANTLNSCCEM